MTKLEAIRIMLEIVTECDKQDIEGGGCKTCPFGHGTGCMASEGSRSYGDVRLRSEALRKIRLFRVRV